MNEQHKNQTGVIHFSKPLKTVFATALVFGFFAVLHYAHCGILKAQAADSPVPLKGKLVANGEVFASKTVGTTTYIGGNFTYVGPNTGPAAVVSATGTGRLLPGFDSIGVYGTSSLYTSGNYYVSASVKKAVSDGSGGWFIGGEFTNVASTTVYNIAHILPSGALDQNFKPNINQPVDGIMISPDSKTLYAWGAFTQVNGDSTHGGIVAFNVDSSNMGTYGTVKSWNPGAVVDFNPTPTAIKSAALSTDGSTVYLFGNFNKLGGTSGVSRIRNLGAVSSADAGSLTVTNWNPTGILAFGVNQITADGSSVYLGGNFGYTNTTTSKTIYNIAKTYAADGNVDMAWNSTVDGQWQKINAFAIDSNYVYLGGLIVSYDGVTRHGLIRVNKNNGSLDASWQPNGSQDSSNLDKDEVIVDAMALSPDKSTLYFSGGFIFINGQDRSRAAAVSTSGSGALLPWNPSLEGNNIYSESGLAIAFDSTGSNVFLGGMFLSANGARRDDVAAIDDSGNLTALNPKVDAYNAWMGDGSETTVYAITASPDNSVVYFGGDFYSVNGVTRNYLAATDPSGNLTSWNPDPDDYIYAIETNSDGSYVFVGGNLTCFNDFSDCDNAYGFAAVSASTGLRVQGWGFGGTGSWRATVYALKRSGSKLYVGGDFSSMNPNNPVDQIFAAQVNVSDGSLTSWNPHLGWGNYWNEFVHDIEVSSSGVYLAGTFNAIGCDDQGNNCTDSRYGIVKVDGTTGALLPWDPHAVGVFNYVNDIEVNGNTVYATGDFTAIGGQPRNHLAALDATVDTNNATAWDPGISDVSPSYGVYGDTLTRNGTTLYVGGLFQSIIASTEQQHPFMVEFAVTPEVLAPAMPVVQFTATSSGAKEQVSNPVIEVSLDITPTATTTIDYIITGGTAINGIDFIAATTSTLTFAPDQSSVNIPLQIIANYTVEPNRTIEFTLSNPTGGTLGANTVHTFTIIDDDGPKAGVTIKRTGSMLLTEGGADGTFTAVLDSKPTADVVVGFYPDTSTTTPHSLLSPSSITFSTSTWNIPQTITVTPYDTPYYIGYHATRITAHATSTDSDYNNIPVPLVVFHITDNQNPSIAVTNNDSHSWTALNGQVNDYLTTPDGTTYMAGGFDYVGKRTGMGIPLRKDDGYAVQSNPTIMCGTIEGGCSGDTLWNSPGVRAVVPDGAGGWYVGGAFDTAAYRMSNQENGNTATSSKWVVRLNLVHILKDGKVDLAWAPDANGSVLTIARDQQNGVVYVGGEFTAVGGKTRNYLAALDSVTGEALDWNPDANNFVSVISIIGDTVYVGGDFTTIDNRSRMRLASIDRCTGTATDWNPQANGRSWAFAQYGNTLYVGGEFTSIGGKTQNFIASFDVTTGAMNNWSMDPYNSPLNPGFVRTMAIDGTTMYIGGDFLQLQGQPRSHIGAIDLTNGSLKAWQPGTLSEVYNSATFVTVYALLVDGNRLLVGGHFNTYQGQEGANNLIMLDKTTGLRVSNWDAITDAPGLSVSALAGDGSYYFVGGDFLSVGGKYRMGLAAVDKNGYITGWKPQTVIDGPTYTNSHRWEYYSLARKDNILYVGGYIGNYEDTTHTVDGATRFGLLSFDLSQNGQITNWAPAFAGNWTGFGPTMKRLYVTGNTLYAYGVYYETIDGNARKSLVSFDVSNPLSPVLTSWDPMYNSGVLYSYPQRQFSPYEFLAVNNTLYVAGMSGYIDSKMRTGIAAFDMATGSTTPWNLQFAYNPVDLYGISTSTVFRMAVKDNTLYIAGSFEKVNGVERPGIAAFDISNTTTPMLLPWNPNPYWRYDNGQTATTTNSIVYVSGNDLYVSGFFNRIDGQTVYNLAKFDVSSSTNPVLTSFRPYEWLNMGGVAFTAPYNIGFGGDIEYSDGTLWDAGIYGVWGAFDQYGSPRRPDIPRVGFNSDFAYTPNATSVYNIPVVLSAATTTTVTIDYAAVGGTASNGSDYSLAPGTVTFAPGATLEFIPLVVTGTAVGTPKTVQLRLSNAVNADLAGDVQTFSIGYAPSVCAGVCGITVYPNVLNLSEGGTSESYTVVLNTQPIDDVIVQVSPEPEIQADKTFLRFTSSNWSVPQIVSVTAPDDKVTEGPRETIVIHAASSPDTSYDRISTSGVTVRVTDTSGSVISTSTPPSNNGGSSSGGGIAVPPAEVPTSTSLGTTSPTSVITDVGGTHPTPFEDVCGKIISNNSDLQAANVKVAASSGGVKAIYTIVVTNNALVDSQNTVGYDRLPGGVSFLSYKASQGTYNFKTGVWNIGRLGSGKSTRLEITGLVDPSMEGKTITNSACVSSANGEANVSDNVSTAAFTLAPFDGSRPIMFPDTGRAVAGGIADSDPNMRLQIPSLVVDLPVEPAGVTSDYRMEAPGSAGVLGWYGGSSRPGEAGNAVITGHLDTIGGTAAFWNLKKLKAGDTVLVRDRSGTIKKFAVIGSKLYDASIPLPEEVVGPSRQARLNLITCAGQWLPSVRTYSQRLVVFTELIP